jgi:uncharacterized repeat protein (TIGR03943 family)
MNRGTQNVLLLLIGLSTGVMVIKGTYLHYVKPSLLPWLIFAAVFLTGLAVVAIVRDLKHPAPDTGHQHRQWLVWLLLVPIALVAFVVPPPLGADGAAPQAAPSQSKKWAFPPLPAGPAPEVALGDVLMRAANDSNKSVDGRLITITGFTMRSGDSTDLARVMIICCAADARLARIHLSGPAITAFPEETWLRVEGQVLPGTSHKATNFVPTLAVSSVTRIEKPANTYTYLRP